LVGGEDAHRLNATAPNGLRNDRHVGSAYDQAVPAVKQALQEQGFGVLTEIDARAT
jgi:uncharacterized protein (DUF302 family)